MFCFKRIFTGWFLFMQLLLPATVVFGQEEQPDQLLEDNEQHEAPLEEQIMAKDIKPAINVRKIARTNEDLFFDSLLSTLPEGFEYSFHWDFGDGNREEGVKVIHSYMQPGTYSVRLTVDKLGEPLISNSIEAKVFVYEKLYLLLTDNVEEKVKIEAAAAYAKERGIYLKVAQSYDQASDFLSEEVLTRQLVDSLDDLAGTDRLVVWTRSSVGLTILSRLDRMIEQRDDINLQTKIVMFITDGNLGTIENLARGLYLSINPKQIILTGSEALWPMIDGEISEEIVQNIEQRGINYVVIESADFKVGITNFMPYLVNFMIDKGIPSNTLKLILVLPIIATVVAFMKQVVGLSTLGVYTPSIIALSFIALDIKFGLLILLVILFMGTLARFLLSRYRLLYIPRIAILLTISSLTIFAILAIGAYFNISELVSISVFPMLIMTTLVEKFVSVQTGQGFKSALLLIVETLFVSILCYYVAEWDFIKTLVLGRPEVIFLFLLFNVFLGKWTGLRLFEYIRFRELIRHSEE